MTLLCWTSHWVVAPSRGFSRHLVAVETRPPQSAAAASASDRAMLWFNLSLNYQNIWFRSHWVKDGKGSYQELSCDGSRNKLTEIDVSWHPLTALDQVTSVTSVTSQNQLSDICISSRTRWSSSRLRSASKSLAWSSCCRPFLRTGKASLSMTRPKKGGHKTQPVRSSQCNMN